MKGALAQQAEAFFKALPTDEERQNVKRVLLALVRVARPGEEGEDTPRPRTRDDLSDALWPTVRTLADACLVVTSRDDVGRETAEIVHEALIRNWPRLKNQWLDKDREFLLWHARCEARALEWQGENDRDRVLRGADLEEAERFLSLRSDGSVSARRSPIRCIGRPAFGSLSD